MKIGAISLGCDKNRVDTEKMLARLVQAGNTVVATEDEADVIIVNTCAFIDKSKEESIDEILSAIAAKGRREGRRVIVTGCLSQRYGEELKAEFPEVDAFMGYADYDGIASVVQRVAKGERVYAQCGGDAFYADRVLTTPYHYAYLKIAEGCNNHCTYCAIPAIRGKYRSEKIEDLLTEAKKLADSGVKELILVAQDVTRYGIDIDGKPHLAELVRALEQLDFDWIRLMYLEPEMVDDDIIALVRDEPKVVKYMDVPLQHVDSTVLRRMNRHTDEAYTRELVKKIKAAGITLRSTFICGFPGEDEQAFEKLREFVAEGALDYAGFFAYSREEGTAAYRMRPQVPKAVRNARANALIDLQQKIIKERNDRLVGSKLTVIYDDIDYDRQMFVGRCREMAPDIDSVVYFTADNVEIGNFYTVEITAADGIDLIGRVTL